MGADPGSGPVNTAPAAGERWPRSASQALIATVVGIGVYVVLDVVAQLLPPHYSPIRQAESDLAVGPYGWIMGFNFVIRFLLSFAFVFGLARAWPNDRPRPRLGLTLVALWGVGALILAFSPTDVSGPATVHGTIHLVTAELAFLFVAVGSLAVSYAMPEVPPWGAIRPYARALAVLTAVALVVLFVGTGLPRVDRDAFGLLERIFLGSALLWMLVVSLLLLRSPEARAPSPAAPS